jgi:hypothetical protein
MYRTIFIDDRGRFGADERRRATRIAHLRAAAERCLRRGILRRCHPASPQRVAR